MKGIEFEEQSLLLGDGGNPNTNSLPVLFATDPQSDDSPMVISKWELDSNDLEVIADHKYLWLCVMGNTMPPVFPTVFHPIKTHGMIPTDLHQEKYDAVVEGIGTLDEDQRKKLIAELSDSIYPDMNTDNKEN